MNKYKSLLHQTAIFGLSSIVLRLINVFLTPFYTHVIPKEAVGILAELLSIVAFLNIIYMVGMETSFFRFSKEQGNKEVYKITSTTVFINSLLLTILFTVLARPIAILLQYPDRAIYIQLLAITLFFENVSNIPFAHLRYKNKAMKLVAIRTFNVLLNVALNLFFLLYIYSGKIILPFWSDIDPVVLIFLANLIPWFLTFLYFSREIIAHIGKIDFPLFKEMIVYSLPLIIVGLAGMTNEVLDRVLLKQYLPYSLTRNLEEIAIYSANYKLSILMTLAIQAFRMGAEPFFFKEAESTDPKKTYAVIMDYFIIACCVILVTVSLNRDLLTSINESSYSVGVRVVPILLLANLFLGIYYNVSIWYKITNNTKKGAVISIVGALITLSLNIYLIPILGYVGSAIATFICYSSMTVLCVLWGRRVYKVPYHFLYNILWIVGSMLYSSIIYYFFSDLVWVMILFSVLFVLLACGLVVARLGKSIIKRTL